MNRVDRKTASDFYETDFLSAGNLILAKAVSLNEKVNRELLYPISKWMDDPDFLKRYDNVPERCSPNWAVYKKKQRQWEARDKALRVERLKEYWREARKKSLYKGASAELYKNQAPQIRRDVQTSVLVAISNTTLTDMVSPFSPVDQQRRETILAFSRAEQLPLSDRVPWRLLMACEIIEKGQIGFADIKKFLQQDKKAEKAAKFQHLLQMNMDGEISIHQDVPFGDIRIEPKSIKADSSIEIEDNEGRFYQFNWYLLSNDQKEKIVADILANKILCRMA